MERGEGFANGCQHSVYLFRNSGTGDVRVRVLHNELDAKLPLAGGPYYPWKELKNTASRFTND